MVALILALQVADNPNLFPDTVSPSKRWVISCKNVSDEKHINYLFDQTKKRAVTVLKNFDGFRGQNHGGMYAAYSKNEDVVAVMQGGRWEPRNLAMVATGSGKQIDLLKMVQKDAADFASRVKFPKVDQLVFDVWGARFEGKSLVIWMVGEIPKQEDEPIFEALTYSWSLGKSGPRRSKVKAMQTKEANMVRWPRMK